MHGSPSLDESPGDLSPELGVGGGHQLGRELNDRRRETTFQKGLGSFETDEASSDDDGGFCLLVDDIGVDLVHVRDSPESEDIGRIQALDGRQEGRSPLRKNELVVGNGGFAFRAPHPYRLRGSVDRQGFGFQLDLNAITGEEPSAVWRIRALRLAISPETGRAPAVGEGLNVGPFSMIVISAVYARRLRARAALRPRALSPT